MSGFAGTLCERVVPLVRSAARDDLGGVAGWSDDAPVWAAVTPAGAGAGDEAGRLARWQVVVRVGGAVPERLRWRGMVLRVRGVSADPRLPDRLTLDTEVLR